MPEFLSFVTVGLRVAREERSKEGVVDVVESVWLVEIISKSSDEGLLSGLGLSPSAAVFLLHRSRPASNHVQEWE